MCTSPQSLTHLLNIQQPHHIPFLSTVTSITTSNGYNSLSPQTVSKCSMVRFSYILIDVNCVRSFLLRSSRSHDWTSNDWGAKRAAEMPFYFCTGRFLVGHFLWAHFDESDLFWDDSARVLGDKLGWDGHWLRTRTWF